MAAPQYTERAKYAQKRMALSDKYNNKKRRAEIEAKFGKQAKETKKGKFRPTSNRFLNVIGRAMAEKMPKRNM